MYCIYEHINKINNKIYIGITNVDPEKRWNKGRGYKSNQHFYEDIKKYGWDNFQHNILMDNLDFRTATEMESLLIYKLDTTNEDKGYNQVCNFYIWSTYKPNKTITRKKSRNSKRCKFDGMEFESMTSLVTWLYKNKYIEWLPSSSIVRQWLTGKSPMPIKLIGKELLILD